jgi:hypothetical protein
MAVSSIAFCCSGCGEGVVPASDGTGGTAGNGGAGGNVAIERACTNQADTEIRGDMAFQDEFPRCLAPTAPELAQCLEAESGLSFECGLCWADLVHCIQAECLTICGLLLDSTECQSCLDTRGCRASFKKCAGTEELFPHEGTGGTGGTAGTAGTGGDGGVDGCSTAADCAAGEVCNEQKRCETASYTLSVTKAGTGTGTVIGAGFNCGSDCSENVRAGTTIELTANAASGSELANWVGCDSTASKRCTVTVTRDATVTASFDQTINDTISLTVPTNSDSGFFTLLWTTSGGGATWHIEEAPNTQFSNPTVYTQIDFVQPYTYNLSGKPDGYYCYRVGRTAGGPFSEPKCITVAAPDKPVLRIVNDTSYLLVDVRLQGDQQVSYPYAWEPGKEHNFTFSAPATVQYVAKMGYWHSNGTPNAYFISNGSTTVSSGQTTTLTISNPSIGALLAGFGTSANWVGEYYCYDGCPSIINFARLNFRSNGSWTVYDNNVQAGTGTAQLVSWPAHASPSFKLCATCEVVQMFYPFNIFYYGNGPSYWPLIEYVRQ